MSASSDHFIQQHVWRSPGTIPRDGSAILMLMRDFEVYSCRYGVAQGCAEDDKSQSYWFSADWSDVQMNDGPEERQRMIGWLPFPLIADPRP
jgi:hypothetical protein